MKTILTQLALAFAAAFALAVATPAQACEGCKDCPKNKAAASADEKAPAKAAPKADKKAPAEKAPAAAPVAGEKKAEGAPKCECGKDGKGCTCKKGECKCANCGEHNPKVAAGEEKPKCECASGKECGCKKGECKCKHEAPKKAA